ncbi:hypothetical protein [Nocardia salmonicida]|uniref:hypothetical protein n=1 Tax=Nocardia salmonicida TaxID=53431 RepID=UPI00340EB313
MQPDRRSYSKPIVVPLALDLLVGPVSGIVWLPRHLDWSGHAEYDLDRPGRIVDFYRAVINEAGQPADLHTYLNESALKQLWSYMWLPQPTRRAWEAKFADLAELSRLASA